MKKSNAAKRRSARRKPLEEPKVVTYDRDELASKPVFTQETSQVISDRNLKKNCKPANAKKIARKLAVLQKPEIVTYERDELVEKTTFTGTETSGRTVSDRNLKRNFRPVRARKILARLA